MGWIQELLHCWDFSGETGLVCQVVSAQGPQGTGEVQLEVLPSLRGALVQSGTHLCRQSA